jgi:hypothetical protein
MDKESDEEKRTQDNESGGFDVSTDEPVLDKKPK